MRQANLKSLFEKAKQYETASFKGLFNFIQFIDKLSKHKGDLSPAKLIGENADVVRIMSIHKSKGLEFPVVFLCKIHKEFNLKDLSAPILLHQDLGFGPSYINAENRIKYNTIVKEIMKIKMKQEALSEEERILYVALTRAKEKLYITGKSKDLEKTLQAKREDLAMYKTDESLKLNPKLIKKGMSCLEWILDAYLANENKQILLKGRKLELNDIVTLNVYKKKDLMEQLEKEDIQEKESILDKIQKGLKEITKEESDKMKTSIEELLSWKYSYEVDTKLPTKTSVTKLKQEKMKLENMKHEENIEKLAKEDIEINYEETKIIEESKENKSKIEQLVPQFMMESIKITNAQKGTLMHLCVQRIDEKQNYTKDDIQNMLYNLLEKEIITKQELEAIDSEKLYAYTKSNLFNELKKAKEIHKEQPFYISIPAKQIIEDAKQADSKKEILVQGIIDLYYIDEEGNLNLVDFKTDHINKNLSIEEIEKNILEKYKVQLEIYKKAIEDAIGKKVKNVSLCLADLNWKQIYLK